MDWSEDWSCFESSPCTEDVFPEQSQALALTSEDVSTPECVQQAEVLAAEAAKQNRNGFFPPSNVPGQRQGQAPRKIERFILYHLWPK